MGHNLACQQGLPSPGGVSANPPPQRQTARVVARREGVARTKKPRRSGAKFLAGVCPSRVKANRRYISTAGCTAGEITAVSKSEARLRFMHHRLRSAGATPVSGGIVGAVGVDGNVIGTNRAASFAASRAAVSARSMKISASMAYSIHIAVTRQTSAYHSILKTFSAAGLDFLPTKKPATGERGLSSSVQPNRACRSGGPKASAARRLNTEPQGWLHSVGPPVRGIRRGACRTRRTNFAEGGWWWNEPTPRTWPGKHNLTASRAVGFYVGNPTRRARKAPPERGLVCFRIMLGWQSRTNPPTQRRPAR